MKKIISKLLILSILGLTFSCNVDNLLPVNLQTGTGSITSQSLDLSPFNEIEIANYCDVEIVTGATNKVEYSDYTNLIQYLKFEVIGSKLVVKTVPENIQVNNSRAKAKVYVNGSLKSLFISGAGDMTILNRFDNISLCDISGAGNLVANESSTSANMTTVVSGAGNINILKINTQNANATVSGSGDISIAVENTLTAKISGVGNISYLGNPTVSKTITGVGEVIKL